MGLFKKTEAQFNTAELTVKDVQAIKIGEEIKRVFLCETSRNRIVNNSNGMRTLSEAVVLGVDINLPATRDANGAVLSEQIAQRGDIIIAFSKDFWSIWEHGFSSKKRIVIAQIIIARTYFLQRGVSNISTLYEKVADYLINSCEGITRGVAKRAWKSLNSTEEKFISKMLKQLEKNKKAGLTADNDFIDDTDELIDDFNFDDECDDCKGA